MAGKTTGPERDPHVRATKGWGPPRAGRGRLATQSNNIVALLAEAAMLSGALSGVHPTGLQGVDVAYGALVSGLIVLASARASRGARLVFAALVMGTSSGLILIPAVATLGLAFGTIWVGRWRQRTGALIGALGSQVLLRWPHVGFQGLTAIIGVVAGSILLVSAYGALGSRRRHVSRSVVGGLVLLVVVLTAPVVIGGLLARRSVTDGIAETTSALSHVGNGDAGTSTAELSAASADFARAQQDLGAWWTAGARLVPIAAQQRQALAVATAAADRVTAAAAKESGNVDYGSLHYAGGGIDLARLSAMATPVAALNAQLQAVQGQIASISSPWLVEPIQSRLGALDRQLGTAQRNAGLATEALRAVPGLLGGNGTRRYFVAFMTPAESRGLDGFIGAFGVLTADNGRLALTSSGPTGELTDAARPGTRHITGPPDYLARYGSFNPQDFFGDLSYAPDLPTVTDVVNQMYAQSGGTPIDGVLGLDPEGLAALLRITGPVAVPGLAVPLTSANAADVLLKQQYSLLQPNGSSTTRHDFLQDAVGVAFPKLVSGSLPNPKALAADLDPAVRGGHLQFWTTHPPAQDLLRRLHVDGSFPRVGRGDLLAVTTDNAGNNKTDAYLQRRIDDRVFFDPATGAVTSHVTVSLHNGAPSAGLPSEVIGSFPGSGLPFGTNRTWVSLYSPLALTSQTATNGQATSSTTTADLGVEAYSSFVNVAPGATVTVTYTLVGHIAPDRSYEIEARLQPMANPDQETIQVSPTAGWDGGLRCTLDSDLDQACHASFASRG